MQTAAVVTALGLGAYLVTKSTREQVEALGDIRAAITPSKTDVVGTSQGPEATARITPVVTVVPKRDAFLDNRSSLLLPDSEQNPTQAVPQFYNFPRKEALSIQAPEIGNTKLTIPILTRMYEKDRVGSITMGTLRDFRDARGEIVDSNSTGQIAPLRATALETIVNQTPVSEIWDLDPHVVRVNDSVNPRFTGEDMLARAVAISPQFSAVQQRPKPTETLRRALVEETASLKPTVTNTVAYSVSRPHEAPMGTNKDRTETRTHITVTPHYEHTDYPMIMTDPVTEYTRKNEYSPRVLITPQWDGPSGVPFMQAKRSRQKADLYDASHTARAGVPENRGWRQMDITARHKRLDGAVSNTRRADFHTEDNPYAAFVPAQHEARKPGLRLQDVGTWTPAFVRNIMDMFTKPAPRGLAQDATEQSRVVDLPGTLEIIEAV